MEFGTKTRHHKIYKSRGLVLENEKLKEIIKSLAGIKKEEWESLKSYVDYKIETLGTIKDEELTFETIKTFFIKCEN